jgi:predicted outer membrane repeat protein
MVENCYFVNCQAAYGGAIAVEYNPSQHVNIMNSTFRDNFAYYGGAIHSVPTLLVSSSLFENNNATYGGAIYYESGSFFNSIFTNNMAANDGGAIYSNVTNSISIGEFSQCQFTQNRAMNGAGLYSYQATTLWQILNSTFTSNMAQTNGGGLYIHSMTTLFSLQNCNITSNMALNGGGIYLSVGPNTDMTSWNSNSITLNQATGTGEISGGLFLETMAASKPDLSLGNLLVNENRPLDYYCNNSVLFLCKEPSPLCRAPASCSNCMGICVPNVTTNMCYASVSAPVCAHGECVFENLPVCVCQSGWKGDLCDNSESNTPLINLWYFWVGIGGGLLLIIIVTIVLCKRRGQYDFIEK